MAPEKQCANNGTRLICLVSKMALWKNLKYIKRLEFFDSNLFFCAFLAVFLIDIILGITFAMMIDKI